MSKSKYRPLNNLVSSVDHRVISQEIRPFKGGPQTNDTNFPKDMGPRNKWVYSDNVEEQSEQVLTTEA